VISAGRVVRSRGSRIPATSRAELATLGDLADDAFHRRQASISYEHEPGVWRGYVPALAETELPRTLARLRRGEPLTVCLIGDSISEGYNASGFMRVPPYQPPYGSLVASALEGAYGSPITLHNFAVAGSTADDGVHDSERVVAANPDLVIVGYGMNDAGYAEADYFAANIQRIIADVHLGAPAAEFVLVAPMLPNPEWDYPVIGRFGPYRDALAGLCGAGVALADLTAVWTELVGRKSWYDLAGNGVNHPNDFGHRLYAQVIFALVGADRPRSA
jgi:lysophospholipase L1-like esterase